MATSATNKTAQRTEFGDWQTPLSLARAVCSLLSRDFEPKSIFEPNCGKGAFLQASMDVFPKAKNIVGLEINPDYVGVSRAIRDERLRIIHDDFFSHRWENDIRVLPEPLLVIGNPPWATNAELMRLQSANLPKKSNINGTRGIDAITGKSNFDISEWMLIKEIEALQGRNAMLAMLCKTAIARKVVLYAWKNGLQFSRAEIREFDAQEQFGVSVDACLLMIRFSRQSDQAESPCRIYPSFDASKAKYILGMWNGRLVSNTETIGRYKNILANGSSLFTWRSGIKHDCAKVMELAIQPDGELRNGSGKRVDIESDLLYPMLKSSDLANGKNDSVRKMMLVPQERVGAKTGSIELLYPKTWAYLMEYAEWLDKRASSIYRNRPRFSIFGVGDYSFKPWKVAISGLYKSVKFRVIGPCAGKPVVLDDTCYLLPCESEEEGRMIKSILESHIGNDILNACIFWDSKRPITRDVLSTLDIPAAAKHIGCFDELAAVCPRLASNEQLTLFGMET